MRQLAQWQRWPRFFVKSSESLMVTIMLPQRQVPLMPEENLEEGWAFGSPVGSLGMVESWGVVGWSVRGLRLGSGGDLVL